VRLIKNNIPNLPPGDNGKIKLPFEQDPLGYKNKK
jgi:hypothetical protein